MWWKRLVGFFRRIFFGKPAEEEQGVDQGFDLARFEALRGATKESSDVPAGGETADGGRAEVLVSGLPAAAGSRGAGIGAVTLADGAAGDRSRSIKPQRLGDDAAGARGVNRRENASEDFDWERTEVSAPAAYMEMAGHRAAVPVAGQPVAPMEVAVGGAENGAARPMEARGAGGAAGLDVDGALFAPWSDVWSRQSPDSGGAAVGSFALTVEEFDRRVERDARRYDGGEGAWS